MEKSNQFLSSILFRLVVARVRQQGKFFKFHQSSTILRGTGIGLAILLLGIYGLTRPCAIGECPSLAHAEKLAANALISLRSSTVSDDEIIAAQGNLAHATALVARIPAWSNYRDRANFFITEYQETSEQLEKIIIALETTNQANVLAQNSPLSLMKLQTVCSLHLNAIAQLKTIPANTQLYSLAQYKLNSYQQALEQLEQNLKAEEKAKLNLEAAKQSAKIAKIRFNNAQSLSDWQSVYSAWQSAIKNLKEIDSKTTFYAESQQLFKIYTPQLIAISKRQQQEASATNLYQKAIEEAELATRSQDKKEWSKAVFHWRNALLYIKQIAPNTFQYSQAQPLIASYSLAFERAENSLKIEKEIQQIRRALDGICAGNNKSCNYIINETTIQIKLTPSYLQQLWQTALQAKAQGNLESQIQLLNHLSQLEQILQNLSNKTAKKIEVYHSDGSLMMVYEPR